MAELLLAEQMLLIALDDEQGSSSNSSLPAGLAGALLTDLAREEALRWDGEALHPVPVAGLQHPLLSRVHEVIAASSSPRSAKSWVQKLPRSLRPVTETVAAALVERGVLSEQRYKILGLFPSTRFPETDPEPERLLRTRLHAVLTEGHPPAEDDALLLGLLVPLGLVDALVDKTDRPAARKRAREIADNSVAGSAVGKVVQEVQAAAMVAVVAGAAGAAAGGAGG